MVAGGGNRTPSPLPPQVAARDPRDPRERERENQNPVPGGGDRRRHPSRSSARCVPR